MRIPWSIIPLCLLAFLPIGSLAGFTAYAHQDRSSAVPPGVVPLPSPTFDFRSAITATPPAPSKCPEEREVELPDLEEAYETYPFDLLSPILGYLNEGGSPWALYQLLHSDSSQVADLTGDDVPEVLVVDSDLYILGCDEGKYRVQFTVPSDMQDPVEILSLRDMNLNGISDIVAVINTCNAPCYTARILEFDGRTYVDMIRLQPPEGFDEVGTSATTDYGTVQTLDLDLDGTIELLVTTYEPPPDPWSWTPTQTTRDIYAWNGKAFVLRTTVTAPPRYRFQAVREADILFSQGNYQAALALYKQATEDDRLDWWSNDRRAYLGEMYAFGQSDSFATPPTPDPSERPVLAAYSRFRTILIHSITGDSPKAEQAHRELRRSSTSRNDLVQAIVEMGDAFWAEYSTSGELRLACTRATESIAPVAATVLTYVWGFTVYEAEPDRLCPVEAPAG